MPTESILTKFSHPFRRNSRKIRGKFKGSFFMPTKYQMNHEVLWILVCSLQLYNRCSFVYHADSAFYPSRVIVLKTMKSWEMASPLSPSKGHSVNIRRVNQSYVHCHVPNHIQLSVFLLISKPNIPPDSKPRPQAGRPPEAMGGKPTKLYAWTDKNVWRHFVRHNRSKTQQDETLLAMVANSGVQSSIYTDIFSQCYFVHRHLKQCIQLLPATSFSN